MLLIIRRLVARFVDSQYMRIGIDGRSLQRRPWSGVGQYTYHLLHALFSLDHENEYVVWYNAVGALTVPEFSEYPNVRVRRTRWPNKILNVLMKITNFPPLRVRGGEEGLRAISATADRHNAPQPPLTLRGGDWIDMFLMPNLNFIALPASVKLVAVAHDLSFEHFPEYFTLKSRLAHRAINPRALFTRADRVIAVSEHTKGDLIETYGVAEEKVTVIYPGVNNCHPEAVAEGSRGIKNDGILPRRGPFGTPAQNDRGVGYILYFGALEPRKNIKGIIEAYEKLRPRQQLVIAGLSTPYVQQLKVRIEKSKLRDKIVLIENPTEDEKAKLYAGAHVFVYPSFYEGFGFPPLEAMAAGVPAVCSSAGSVPEICGDAAILVSPWKVDEIKAGMEVLLEDNKVRAHYIAAGHQRVAQFSWARCAQQVFEVLRSVV